MNIKEIRRQAKEELEKEQLEEAKKRFKTLYSQLVNAKKVVANLEREIEDLEDKYKSEL